MRQRGALFPLVALLGWDIHEHTVIHSVQHLPKMVIGVAQTHTLAREPNVVHIEIRQAWRENAHADHRTVSARHERNVKD